MISFPLCPVAARRLAVCDTPPRNSFHAATRVLMLHVPHRLSSEGVRQLVRALFPVMSKSNRALNILGFVPMQQAHYIGQPCAVTGNVGKEFGASRLLPGIQNDIRLAEAIAAGPPSGSTPRKAAAPRIWPAWRWKRCAGSTAGSP